MAANPAMTLDEANAAAWGIGKERLENAIKSRTSFNFETTLGGATIARLLTTAHAKGLRVRVWYCGLRDAELHIARVRARVLRGGHHIAEKKIRERFDASRNNLCSILPTPTLTRVEHHAPCSCCTIAMARFCISHSPFRRGQNRSLQSP